LDYVFVKIQTPNFPQLEVDRNIFCDNYTQALREIPFFRSIPELTSEHNRKLIDLVNSYKVSLGLAKILDVEDDNIGDENKSKFQIKDTHNISTMPTNPYANLGIANKGTGSAQGLLNQFVAGQYFRSAGDMQTKDFVQNTTETQNNNYFKSSAENYEESNKNNLIRTFKQKTNSKDEEAKFFLESTNYDLQKALEFFNNNK